MMHTQCSPILKVLFGDESDTKVFVGVSSVCNDFEEPLSLATFPIQLRGRLQDQSAVTRSDPNSCRAPGQSHRNDEARE